MDEARPQILTITAQFSAALPLANKTQRHINQNPLIRMAQFTLPALGYSIGFIAILVEWRSYTQHCPTAFRRYSACAAVLWATQYFLLAAWTAGLTMASTAIRTLFSIRLTDQRHKHYSAIGFVILFVLLTIISWQGYISLLPAFAVINTSLALFYLNNRNMRIALIFSSLAWISNDLYWQAWPALIAEAVAIGINTYTIIKIVKT